MSKQIRVLNLEDSEDDALLLLRALRRGGYDPIWERVDTSDALQAALEHQTWDIILSDFAMPQFDVRSALKLVKARDPDLPFIIISGSIGEDTAVAAMKAGAHDYLMKDNLARLIPAIERELREAEARREHKRLEQQLLQAQKMESVGRLAGGIAHDFNNLLTTIIGYAELAETGLSSEDPSTDNTPQECLQNVQEAAQRAAALTRQLLAFARKQVIEPKLVNLNDQLYNVEKILRRLIGEDIELVTLPDPDLGLARVDPGQFEQVLLNLVVNARDAMPDGGRLTIETANVILDDDYIRHHFGCAPGEYVMLTVSDTGMGMDAVTQARVFEPFFTTKEVGNGTVFEIYLPRTEGATDETPRDAHEALPQGKETVLLVEDEQQVRAVEAYTLRAQGYQVLEAINGVEAQCVVQKHGAEIHLLISDVVMPQMGGKALSEWIRSVYPTIRILLTSGYTDVTIAQHGALEPDVVLLQKPFSPRALVRKVQEVLGT